MLKNYLKIAFRNIFKQKGYSFINITGLTIGIACCIFLLLWVQDELSYDKFHKNAKNLYRVEQDQKTGKGIFHVFVTSYPMGPGIKEVIPEIENMTRVAYGGVMLLKYGENSFYERNIMLVDPSFLKMFTFPLINGNAETALSDPSSIIITEEMAKKYFGDDNPMGKTIKVNNTYLLTVSGIMKNIPLNSTLRPDVLIHFELTKKIGQYNEIWGSNNIITFVQLNEKSDIASVNEKITNVVAEHVLQQISSSATPERINSYRKNRPDFMLMPLTDIRLLAYFGYGQRIGNAQSVYILSGLAIFILLIACINFINLATARSANRAKEVGVRKVVGALRKNIILQFFSESILITIIALFFSMIIVIVLLSPFNDISGKQISTGSLINWNFIIGLIGIVLIAGIISGSYPALFLSLFQPVKVLKGSIGSSAKSGWLRKILVVTQFCLSIILLIGTVVIYQQLQFMRNKKVGYDKEQLIYINLRGETQKSYEVLKEELVRSNNVLGVTGTWQPPTSFGANSSGANWDGKDPDFRPLIGFGIVDFDYVETMKIEMTEGRPFSKNFSTDTSNAVLINEEVVKLMGIQSAVGKRFDFVSENAIIIGVMKNYHYQSIQNNIEPLAVYVDPNRVQFAVIRLPAGDIKTSIEKVKTTWNTVFPAYPFEYKFFDEDFNRMFQTDERMGTLLKYAAVLAILIACLGLFGLASFMAEQRTKEIGIRKVLGATVSGITMMLSKEFIQWVMVANLIAGPAAYFLTKKLLQNYAYRISVEWWVYGLAICLTLLIAMFTISWQTIKAARANPAVSIKYE